MGSGLVERYLALGLSLGRHVEGLVDAYYGPPELAERAASGSPEEPSKLAADARALIVELDAGGPLDSGRCLPGVAGGEDDDGGSASTSRRRWLRAQLLGLFTTAEILAGRRISYADEVERCYGVRPRRAEPETFERAHELLAAVVPGNGSLAARLSSWREAQAVPPDRLEPAIRSLADDLGERTRRMFPLPPGEHVSFELVHDRPWSGFNHYLGDFNSRVELNVDLPVLSIDLARLVAHEAYPGHHTEHSRKEAGLVRSRRFWEESIFLVGTPQCLLAEGLADLGLEVVMGRRPEPLIAEHMRALGIPYEAEVVAAVREASEGLGAVRGNAAFRLHEDGADPDVVVDEVAKWGLLTRQRAEKAVSFLMHPTWRAYVSCYVEGLPLCRRFVGGSPERFSRLVTEQLVPEDLSAG